jgi:dihydroorotase
MSSRPPKAAASAASAALADLEVGARVAHLELDGVWAADPIAGREGPADLVVEDGVMTSLDWAEGEAGRRQGLVLAPGFTDLHAHFREPGFEDAETVATGQAAAAHGGFTTVCAMPNTDPPLDEASTLGTVLTRATESGNPVRVLAWGAATRRREGKGLADLGDLAEAGAIGFCDDGAPIAPGLLRNVLAYAGMLGRLVADHAEDRDLTAGAEANEGLVATILGLKGWPRAAEESVIARDIAILADVLAADQGAARLHLTHVSTGGGIELIRRAKAAGLPVTCDVTPHHLALSDEWLAGARRWSWQAGGTNPWDADVRTATPYDTALKVNPPLRSPEDALALLAAVRDGTVDAIATDHAPHTLVDKEVEFGAAANGISGIETALGLLLEAVAADELGLLDAIRLLTVGPERVLAGPDAGKGGRGSSALEVGRAADLVLFDPDDAWLVSESSLRSKGKNSPLLGRSLPGRVLATIAGGRLAYVDL